MVQYQKSTTGFNKGLNILFGQATTSTFAHFAVPDWFWEGDATIMETALTRSGRGRLPRFSMVMRSNLLEKGPFTYNKQQLGSFKDNIPNEYVTGYFFTGYLREKYDTDIMAKVTKHAWSWSFVPFTFSNSLKKYTGKHLVKNYKEFMNNQEEEWEAQNEKLGTVEYPASNERKNKIFTNYSYPHIMNDGKILALKEGLGDIATFIALNENGAQTKIVVPGFMQTTGRISFNGRQIVWDEITPDLRWGARNYSDIKLYDLNSGGIQKITKNGKYASSAISPDGQKIVSVLSDTKGQNSLVVLDLSGKIIHQYQDPENALYVSPDWTEDSRSVLAIKLVNRKKSIVRIDPEKNKEEIIYEGGYENISYPKLFENYLFYQSSYNGIDNIYVIDTKTGQHYQVTNAQYGAYYPYYDERTKKLYFSDHQKYGLNITSIDFNVETLNKKSSVPVAKDVLADILEEQEAGVIEEEDIPDYDFPYERYSRLKGIIHPHSWGVTLGSLNNDYTFFINSRDIRSTTLINAGYTYNINEHVGEWQATASYQGLYPIIDLTYFNGKRQLTEEFLDTARGFKWNEKGMELGLRLPLNLTRSKYAQGLLLGVKAGYVDVSNYYYPYEARYVVTDGNLQSLKLNAFYSRVLKTSKRDIRPKWGEQMKLFGYFTPFLGDYQSTLLAAEGSVFLPGIFRHHSLQIRAGYQYEDKWNYTFTSPILFPRGYTYSSFDNFYTTSVNYALPLMYPDLGIGPLLYIQRIRANLFYDFGRGIRESRYFVIAKDEYYNSMGVEFNFDFNIMRYQTLLDIGFRVNYLPEENDYSFDLVIGSLGF